MIDFYELKDLCIDIIDCPHSTPKWLNEGIPVIRNYNISGGQLDLSKLSYVDEETYKSRIKRAKPIEDDIIISREAPMGEVCLVPPDFKCCLGQRLVLLKVDKEKCNPHYLLYALLSPYVQAQIRRIDQTGSIVSNLNIPDLKKLVIPYIKENQNNIARCLEVINKKIFNNNKINEELESMAKTIYDYWFLQFEFPNEDGKPYKSSDGKMVWSEELKREIPEGWKVKRIDDFGKLNNGINYNKNEVGDKSYKIVNVRNISETSLLLSKTKMDDIVLTARTADNYLLKENDILIARSGIPGAVRILNNDIENTIYCGFIICLRLASDLYRRYLVYKLKDYENTTATTSGGTIMQNVSQGTLKSIKFAVPEKRYILKFNEKIDSIWSNMQNNEKENQALVSLRNFLLPLLMNGQVGFKDVV